MREREEYKKQINDLYLPWKIVSLKASDDISSIFNFLEEHLESFTSATAVDFNGLRRLYERLEVDDSEDYLELINQVENLRLLINQMGELQNKCFQAYQLHDYDIDLLDQLHKKILETAAYNDELAANYSRLKKS